MADIAAVFHWPPEAMWEMEVAELMRWHALALERLNALRRAGL